MLRLERARTISTTPPVNHDISQVTQPPLRRVSPEEFVAGLNEKSAANEVSVDPDSQTVRIVTDDSKYGTQLRSTFAINPHHDYLLRVPVQVDQGRVVVELKEANSRQLLSSVALDKLETKEPSERPAVNMEIPFASGSEGSIFIEVKNAAAQSSRSIVYLGTLEIYELGPATFLWTRYPRVIVATIQRLFITACMLPLALIGVVLLLKRQAKRALILLLVIPVYYLSVQSILHTEYRYVLAIHYFLFILVAVALEWGLSTSNQFVLRRKIGTNVK